MIDTHCHLSLKDKNLDDVIKKMNNDIIIVSGADHESNKEVITLCNKYPNVYGTIGLHPDEADTYKQEYLDFVEKNITNKKIVGIGEIGLDYYYTKDNKDKQIKLFEQQINIALKYNKPIVVHSREAANDTYEIMKKNNTEKIKSVIHCYSYSVEMAYKFIKLGSMLGIGGVVTFKNGTKLKEVVKEIDLNNLLLETDSPYLAPEPFRGTRNEPYNIIFVAREIAKIKNISEEEVLKQTTLNAVLQFDLNLDL